MIFHKVFASTFFAMMAIRIFYRAKAVRGRQGVEFKEGWLNITLRAIFGSGYLGGLLVYIVKPAWFAWADLTLASGLRGLGVVISVGSILLLWWVQWALGVQFDTTLHIQTDHRLITHGPYRWVRHPMYTSLFLLGFGWLALTANWLVGIPFLFALMLLVLVRLKNEEALMMQTFGDEYRRYQQCTGKFLPRWSAPE